MCKRFADNTIAIQRFVNPGDHQHPAPAGSEQGGVFTPLPSTFVDGVVTCQFNLSNFTPQTAAQPNTLRPLTQSGKYYPIFATGIVNATGKSFSENMLKIFEFLSQIFVKYSFKNN